MPPKYTLPFNREKTRDGQNIQRLLELLNTLDARVPLSKYDATAAPGVGDDSADGYGVGSVWVNVTADDGYMCMDATAGAAVWKKVTP